ncbi:MAG: TIGR03086 family metal-binding protein [Terracoccus sp.]
MTVTSDRYTQLADRFGDVVDSLTPPDWGAASPCEGWTARDVLAHVMSTQRDFLAQHGVDAGSSSAAEFDPAQAWHAHDRHLRELLADPAVADLEYDGVFGRSTIGAAITTFYGFDLIVHRWDLAQAAGREEVLDAAELDTIEASADSFGEHLYGEGVCKPAVDVPDDADRQTRVLARLGRRSRVRAT